VRFKVVCYVLMHIPVILCMISLVQEKYVKQLQSLTFKT
jgi:hypothetical protein